jgi:hypothetical protein
MRIKLMLYSMAVAFERSDPGGGGAVGVESLISSPATEASKIKEKVNSSYIYI